MKPSKTAQQRDIRNLFEYKEEDYYKPVRVANFLRNKYIDINGDRNKTLSTKEYILYNHY